MQRMTLPSSLSTADLAQRCAEETDKYYRRDDADPQLCYELLRRALREQQPEAFTHVAQIFERFVMSAVRQHPRFALTNERAILRSAGRSSTGFETCLPRSATFEPV